MRSKKSTISDKISTLLEKFKDDLSPNYKTKKIVCNTCKCQITTISKQSCENHLKSEKHKKNKRLKDLEYLELKLTENKKMYWGQGFSSAGIPINNFRKPAFRNALLEIDRNLPSPNTARKIIFDDYKKSFS